MAVWLLGAVDANAQLSVFSQAGLEYKRFTWHAETKPDGQTADLLLTTIKIQPGEILFPVAMEYENMSIKAVISYPDGTKLTYSGAPQKSDWLDVVGPASVDLKTTLHTYANFSYALVFNYLIKKDNHQHLIPKPPQQHGCDPDRRFRAGGDCHGIEQRLGELDTR